jgi:hypothetical protein
MARMRSPNYPSIPLSQAVALVREIHSKNRTNVIDRQSAARDMGYSGLTGRSLKLLGALGQFDLVSKAGKGDLKVTQTAVDILHGLDEETKAAALRKAGTSPRLFKELFERFPEGIPSENVIRSYLVQQGYGDAALGPAIKSFIDTNHFLENAAAIDSHGEDEEESLDSEEQEEDRGGKGNTPPPPPPPPAQHGGYRIMEGERVVFSEETGSDQYLKLVAAGEMDDGLLEALEDYIRRQRKRLGVG